TLDTLQGDYYPIKFNFLEFDPVSLPIDSEVKIKRIITEKLKLFKSAKLPFLFVCETIDDEEYSVIFKNEDNVTEDQLILEILTVMDKLKEICQRNSRN
ncbi:unnamed protein product, partial [Didymodactylos carnosus]